MTSKEVNVSFSLNISLEDALALLSRCSQKSPLSIHSAKSTEKANPLKRQSAQSGEKFQTFKKIPIPTLKRVLAVLKEQYADTAFRYADALRPAEKLGISRTIVGYSLQYAIQAGKARKISLGNYTFKAKTKYEPSADSLIDIVTQDIGRLLSTLKLMSKVSENVKLYFGESGLTARFWNQEKNGMLDIRIGKDVFAVYHVKQHIRLVLSCKQLLQVLSKKAGEFHIMLKEKGATYNAGYLGNEHALNAIDCSIQESPYEVEIPLDPNADTTPYSVTELPRSLLQDILKDVRLHSDAVRILCKDSRAIFDSSFDSMGYSKELLHNDRDIKIQSVTGQETNACFEINTILPLVKERVSKSDLVTLRISKAAMIIQLMNEEGFKAQYLVAPCRVEEADPAAATSKKTDAEAQLKDLAERIDRLTNRMETKSTGI
jgi:hypothetical protein